VVERVRLLVAVAMQAAPSTGTVAKRLALSRPEAEAALREAERAHLVVASHVTRAHDLGRQLWRLSDRGQAELRRLLAADRG
jgi:DNA-binding PadR family transcriptional regulator